MKKFPYGVYDVAIEDLMLAWDKETGDPVVYCLMQITAGDWKGKTLCMKQTVKEGFQVYRANVFLRGLCAKMGIAANVSFECYSQYHDMILDIDGAIPSFAPCRVFFSNRGCKVMEAA